MAEIIYRCRYMRAGGGCARGTLNQEQKPSAAIDSQGGMICTQFSAQDPELIVCDSRDLIGTPVQRLQEQP